MVSSYHEGDYALTTNVKQATDQITYVKDEDAELLRTLGGRVKWARGQRKLSQTELATQAGVSQGTIGNIESGVRKRPRELLAIARALNASAAWLESGRGDWEVPQEAELLDIFSQLSTHGRSALTQSARTVLTAETLTAAARTATERAATDKRATEPAPPSSIRRKRPA